jgi:hypothetical protein
MTLLQIGGYFIDLAAQNALAHSNTAALEQVFRFLLVNL